MIKKITRFIFVVAGLLLTVYFLQPGKKGRGIDTTSKYELVENWLHLPKDLKLGNPTGIGMDTSQNVVVLHRAGRKWPLLGSMPGKAIQGKTVFIVNKNNGTLINSWGSHLFIMPHGLKVDEENNIWITDVGLNQVLKFNYEGKLLMKLGEAKLAGNDSLHFNKPTDIAVSKDGSFYVSDGYGNSRIIKFSASGKYLFEWGKKGDKESEFDIPHGIAIDENGNVYVADRENNRVQIFDSTGKFIKQFADNSFGAMCAVATNNSKSQIFAVDDLSFLKVRHRGSDVFMFDSAGRTQTRFGRSGNFSGPVSWYHALTIDKDENIYVCDILNNTIQKFKKVSSR